MSISQRHKHSPRWLPCLTGLAHYPLFLINILLCLSLSSHIKAEVKAENLHNFSLSSLQNKGQVPLSDYKDKILLLSFFEPDCKWCYKQMKAFNQLQEDCSHSIQPIAVGVHGRRSELKQELRKAKVSYPAFIASDKLLQATGDIASTPITLIIGAQGEFIAPLNGYITLEKFHEIFPVCQG